MTDQRLTNPGSLWLKLVILLTALVFLEFLTRGPFLAMQGRGSDMTTPYVAAVRLLHHQDPYSPVGVLKEMQDRGIVPAMGLDESSLHPIYPPIALTLFLPLALFQWTVARALYVLLCAAFYTFIAIRFAGLIGTDWRSLRRWFFLAFVFGLAPMQTAIRLANPSAIACILFLLSLLLAYEKNDTGAALSLALCLCMKPTIGPPAVLFFLLCRRWRLLAFCAGFIAVVGAITLLFMVPIDRSWIPNFRENTNFLFSREGAASFFGPYSACINLQMPFFAIFRNEHAANILAWISASLITVWWILAFRRSSKLNPQWNWPLVAAISLIGLLPVYQRNYNAGIVLLALLLVFQHLELRESKAILFLAVVFLLPIRSILFMKVASHLPHAFIASSVWQAGFLCLDSWALVAIVILAIRAASQQTLSA